MLGISSESLEYKLFEYNLVLIILTLVSTYNFCFLQINKPGTIIIKNKL